MLSSIYLVEYTLHQNLVIEIYTRNFYLKVIVPSPNLAFLCRNLDYKPYSINQSTQSWEIPWICEMFIVYSLHLVFYFLVVFLFLKKNTYCPSVRLCLSLVEITLVFGCTITNRPIDLKFGLNIEGRVMHV